MADLHLTHDQQAAVHLRGSSLLVSAAAGSGKTRVLVERLMAYVTDPNHPRDIDTFLIITYTRAAAAELHSRILSDLRKRSAAQPENRRLRRQVDLCHRTQIGTIHSFCTTILRENCHLLGLAPDFTVADEARSETVRRRTLERLLERRYETIDTDAGFQALVDTVGAGRNDDRLIQVVDDLYQKLQSHPYPEEWVAAQIQAMDVSSCTDIAQTIWGQTLLSTLHNDVCYWATVYDQLLTELYSEETNGKIIDAYGTALTEDAEQLRAICRTAEQSWEQTRAQFPFTFGKLKALRNSPNPALSDRIKACRKALKSKAEEWAGYFDGTSEELLSDLAATAPAMNALLQLTLELSAACSKEKRRQNIVDFSDLEHFAVQLLVQKENRKPTELAKRLSLRYTEIMIDEFQDVNEVQDLLFRAISREETNLFMVGDVKQSIYRFRLADPQIFIRKYHAYADATTAEEGVPRRILLRENFRSQPSVLDSTNLVFENIMSTELGDIAYDDNARLRCGTAILRDPPTPTTLYLLSSPPSGDKESPGKARQEADFIAAQIQSMIAHGETVLEKDGGTRPMTYGDIVILMRSPGSSGSIYHTALSAAGIPVISDNSGGFFTSPEISTMLSLLSIVDNPHQDVPLTSVLRSPIFGFTPDELAQIRICNRTSDFYTALCEAAEFLPKCRSFLQTLQGFRARAADFPVDQMIWSIYTETDLMALCSTMPDGNLRRQRLMVLFRYAGQFESDGNHGLFLFLAWINRLIARGEEPRLETDTAQNAVSILSIHKSKGLEFPVVFLADTAHRFNKSDTTAPVLIHSVLGLGPRYTDLERNVEYPTTARRAIHRRILQESLSEEMRVLYVAMTRAKERLILTASLPNPEKKWEELQKERISPIPAQVLLDGNSFADWLLRVAVLDEEGALLQVQFVETKAGRPTATSLASAAASESPEPNTAAMLAQIQRRLDYVYPHSAAIDLPSKLTATEVEDLPAGSLDSTDGKMLDSIAPRSPVFRIPDFSPQKQVALSGAEIGTAVHLVMQHIDFSKATSVTAIRQELERLTAQRILQPEQAAAIRVGQIYRFFASETGQRLRRAEQVVREFRFSLLMPASRYFSEGAEEEVLLQGVIDCFFEEAGKLTILDYKTDFINDDNLESKIQTYLPQLRAYRDALERILGKPVSGAILYFLGAGLAVPLALEQG